MRNTVIWSLLSVVALATGGLVTGCDSDAKLARSAIGDSCDTTADCDDNLRCIDHTCYKKGTTSSGGSSNSEGGDGTGPTVTGPKPPVLGGEGESCTKRADCEDGLACLAQRCQKDVSTGMGGEGSGPTGPTLGGPGETCGLTSDCAAGLACLPSDGSFNNFPETKAIGSNSVGVCTATDNGLEPTGKSCNGAECATADDCCELPVYLHAANASAPTYGTGVNSCAELAVVLDGVNCDAAVLTTQNAARCFAQTAYCTCGKTTWTCSDANRCVYSAACTKNFGTPGGCPSYSRAGYALTSACDTEGSGKCEPPAALADCKTDAECDKGLVVADGGGIERCTAGECTCYKKTACYRKCSEDLDCAKGKTCDTKTKVCVPAAACESDAYCVAYNNDIHSKCLMPEGVCDTQCDNDRECNYGSLTYGSSTRVCNAMHRCELVGCTNDSECPAGVGGVKLFCTTPVVVEAGTSVSSAVTD
jgi:hypothetical protein